MVESRCGCICSKCEYRESKGCVGCIAMDKPFWSDSCDLKSCCEAKGLEHCGLCSDFPCEKLISMAEDDKNYDYGSRIDNCKKWVACAK